MDDGLVHGGAAHAEPFVVAHGLLTSCSIAWINPDRVGKRWWGVVLPTPAAFATSPSDAVGSLNGMA
ncbi:hypothetical protein ACWEIJ_12440 [Lentzea sp. NPDC004789]